MWHSLAEEKASGRVVLSFPAGADVIEKHALQVAKEQGLRTRAAGGEEVMLRHARVSDAPFVTSWRTAKADCFFTTRPPTITSTEAFLQSQLDSNNALLYILESRGLPFGHISLYNIDPNTGKAEYGRTIRGVEGIAKGGVTAATRELLRFAFDDLTLSAVYLHVFADNLRAKRLYYACGFIGGADYALQRTPDGWQPAPQHTTCAERFATPMELDRARYEHMKSAEP